MLRFRQPSPGSPPAFPRRSPIAPALVLVPLLLQGLAPVPPAGGVSDDGSGISGTVTDREGRPLTGISVSVKAYVWDQMWPRVQEFGWASTDASGAYRTGELPPQPYWVCFADPGGQMASECYGGGPTSYYPSYSRQVTPFASGIDAVLDPAGSVSGRMTSGDGRPVSGRVTLSFRDPHGRSGQVREVWTDDGGRYTFGQLPSATYFLHFFDPTFSYDYEFGSGEYWHNVPAPQSFRATPVMLAPGQQHSCIDEVVGAQVENIIPPTISGTAQVGNTLAVSGDAWAPDDATVRYQWIVGTDSDPTDDPIGPTYVPTSGDVGRTIQVRATGSHPEQPNGSVCSAPTAAVIAAPVAGPAVTPAPTPAPTPAVINITRPRITGTPEVGRVLRVTRGAWQPATAALTYRWYAGGKAIVGASQRRLVLTARQVGKRVKVRVTATATDHRRAVVWTAATKRTRP